MKKHVILLAITLAIMLHGCANESDSSISKKVIISGKILNQSKYPDNYTIKLFENNLISITPQVHVSLIDNGEFKIEFEKSFPSDIYLEYGGLHILFANPGDSIYIEMDADEILNPSLRNQKKSGSVKFSGDREKINNDISTSLPLILNNEDAYETYINEKSMPPDSFLYYVENIKEKQRHTLDSLQKTNSVSQEFIKWSQILIDYQFAKSLFHYAWYYPFANSLKKSEFKVIPIPRAFYTAIKQIPIDNENAIINSIYPQFLHDYFLTNTDYNSEFYRKYRETKGKIVTSESFGQEFEEYIQETKQDFKGIAYEIILGQELYSLLDTYKRIDVFENLYPKYKNNLRTMFAQVLDNKYSEIKLQQKNPETNQTLVKQNNGTEIVVNEVFNGILARNKGKLIYLDFWATWCGPCLAEFANSRRLQETFKGKNIEFIYLCAKSRKDEWQNKIHDYNLAGQHYLLNDSEFDILSQKFQISGIPHYVLIDQNGNVIDRNAARPSSGDQLISIINKNLK